MATDGYWLQDSHVLPPEIEDIFRRVQDSAHYMPDWQMEVAYLVLQPQHGCLPFTFRKYSTSRSAHHG